MAQGHKDVCKNKNHARINQWEWKGNKDEATMTHAKNRRSHNNKPLRKATRTRDEGGDENKNEATATLQGQCNEDKDDATRTRQ